MTQGKPHRAFILAAGFGSRLRPYTDFCPKPMVQVAGRSLIARTLDKLVAAGVDEVVVNTHYLADMLREHVLDYADVAQKSGKMLRVHISHEEEILDTGGGVKKALPIFGDEPFFVIAGDGLWEDGPSGCALRRLADHWDAGRMDIITLMQPLSSMILTRGAGDYDLLPEGHVRRSFDKSGTHMWTNIRLNSAALYRDAPSGAFSVLNLMDASERAGRFYALEHDGQWHHISTPADLEAVDADYKAAGR